MINMSLLISSPLFAGDIKTKSIIVAVSIVLGCLSAFISWVLLLSQLISLAEGKKSSHQFLVWSFILPFINVLWVPWALIFGNGYVKKAQDKFYQINATNSAMGVQILSVPLLLLYLFWGVLGFIMRKSVFTHLNSYEVALYVGIILVCLLIVFGTYLVYLTMFVHKLRHHLRLKNNPRTN